MRVTADRWLETGRPRQRVDSRNRNCNRLGFTKELFASPNDFIIYYNCIMKFFFKIQAILGEIVCACVLFTRLTF